MKTIITFCLCVLGLSALSQTDTLHIHFFDTGQLSTLITMTDRLRGTAAAYDRTGKAIYEKEVSRMHGSTSVTFKHYDNGAVKTAELSSHPDAGIQWSRKTTEFSESGEVIRETNEIHDPLRPQITIPDPGPERRPPDPYPPVVIPQPNRPNQPEKKIQTPPRKEVVECATIYQNRTEVVNHTKYKLRFRIIHKNEEIFIDLKPGDTKPGVTYISAEVTSPPHLNMNVDYTVSRKRRNDKIRNVVMHLNVSPSESTYSFHVFESTVGE